MAENKYAGQSVIGHGSGHTLASGNRQLYQLYLMGLPCCTRVDTALFGISSLSILDRLISEAVGQLDRRLYCEPKTWEEK